MSSPTLVPYARDGDNNIIFNDKHREYVRAILDPDVWIVEAEGAKRAGKDVYGLSAYAMLLDMHDNLLHLGLATTTSQAVVLLISADGFGLQHHFPNGELTEGDIKGKMVFRFTDSLGRTKQLVLCGGSKANSYESFRGPNYGTSYLNEANLLHLNTLNEAKDRTMSSTLPKIVITQNPGNPSATFYTMFEKIFQVKTDEYKNDNPNEVFNGPDFKYFHFTQWDNPIMTRKQIEKNERSFTSDVEKKRNFFGIRIAEEGLIYDMLNDNHFYKDDLTIVQKINYDRYIGVDVGTTNPQVYLDCYIDDDYTVYVENELEWDSRKEGRTKTDSVYADDLIEFIRGNAKGQYDRVIVDPSAASFISACKAVDISVKKADNTVVGKIGDSDSQKEDNNKKSPQGVHLVRNGFVLGKILINKKNCPNLVRELRSYVWDAKSKENGDDRPMKVNDHGPDALRYIINTVIKNVQRWRY